MTIQRVSNHKRQRTLRNHEIVVIDSDSDDNQNTDENDSTQNSKPSIINLSDDDDEIIPLCNNETSSSDPENGDCGNHMNHNSSDASEMDDRKHRVSSTQNKKRMLEDDIIEDYDSHNSNQFLISQDQYTTSNFLSVSPSSYTLPTQPPQPLSTHNTTAVIPSYIDNIY
ncbi:unnamed protein product [Ambrosiozyma monospora]|uniref:Unnamed protein product n=1 Tax=Ambrosiozyma monospora TaxID=43982 RepID=A0ACB5U8B2_AMBMO|nr:unnamed protein product [Ambrosiozyma monospora]